MMMTEETGRDVVDWILVSQDRVQRWISVNTEMNVPKNARNFMTSCATLTSMQLV
jgi:hypothetical protein